MSEYQEARDTYYRLRCEKTARSLRDNGFDAVVVSDREEAAETVMGLIGPGDTVGVPGTVTIRELNLLERLSERGNHVVQHWVTGKSGDEMRRLRLEQMNSDVLLTSTNAVTLDGKLINIDGTGNRVASMVFGPKKVIIVAGANKIAHDLEEGITRSRRVAGPINALRLGGDRPCAKTGYCTDCGPSTTICAITVIMERKPGNTEVTVVLVPEDLGY